MRAPALFLLTAASLAAAACSKDEQSANTMNVDESLTAANISSNDVTAIDAVTGADANMAASAEINDIGPEVDLNAAKPAAKPAPKAAAKSEPAETTNSAD